MGKERFQSTDETSFHGDCLYDRIVLHEGFLRKLKEVLPRQRFTYKLLDYYRSRAREGRPSHST